jgi:hypothetical protein
MRVQSEPHISSLQQIQGRLFNRFRMFNVLFSFSLSSALSYVETFKMTRGLKVITASILSTDPDLFKQLSG